MPKRQKKEEHVSDSSDAQDDGDVVASDDEVDDEEDSHGDHDSEADDESEDPQDKEMSTAAEIKSNGDKDANEELPPRKPKKVHKLSLTTTEDFNEKLNRRGVLYIARIPPRMNPTKIKSLLSDFGTVTRVYLMEEDAARRKRRQKTTGSGGKRYVEGWVEFEDKGVAKHVSQNLNNTPISMHKRNVHYGDLWNVKYLHKFQWSHLTEKVAYERRVREQKLRVEMMQARRENANYTQLVETGKKLDKIEARKRKQGTAADLEDAITNKKRRHWQTKPMEEEGTNRTVNRAVLSSLV